ncbi:histidinol-phosphate transaminase [Aminipila butyrica]|uniref:Histidinol-phosphate aminotransferase n=1 Tax=Aminipila butyrica TaxID=433296 RepID=A0A858BSN0_9FIRM|nr:histidinol-phosphate transaminase [Aminipila butyrica]QIB68115.1 histidinol-phosphate transaminase [Aminipila butyrica]
MGRFFSIKYDRLRPYEPGEPIQQKKTIKLNTNESPYPASPFVYRSIDQFEIDNLRLYSDPSAEKLIKAIAKNFSLDESQVAVGNGSDELLALVFMAFQNQEGRVYFPELTYEFYSTCAEAFCGSKIEVPLGDELTIDPADYCGLDGTIVLANPNTPTGLALTRAQVEAILRANSDNLVVIDEAYGDYGAESCVPLIEQFSNLLVIQTFSKSRNLAGARIGFAMGSPELIQDMNRIKRAFHPHNINRLSVIAGTASMKDQDYFKKCINDVKRTREAVAKELRTLGFTVLDSQANFLFARYPSLGGGAYCQALKEKNILVKHSDSPKIVDYVRITIGTPEQMEQLLKATRDILGIEELRDSEK